MTEAIRSSSEIRNAATHKEVSCDFPNEVMLKIFLELCPKELAICARVCSAWNSLIKETIIWKNLVLDRYGEEAIVLFEPFIQEVGFTWKEVLQFPNFARFFNQIIEYDWNNRYNFSTFNPHSEKYEINRPCAAYADFRFSIVDSTNIKVQKGEGEPFILQGEKDKFLLHLVANGDFVFALTEKGILLQWNYKKNTLSEVPRLPDHAISDDLTRFELHDDFIIILDDQAEIIPLENPEKAFFIKKWGKKITHYRIAKDRAKICFAASRSISIFWLATDGFVKFPCIITGDSMTLASSKDHLFIADTFHQGNREIFVYNFEGKKQRSFQIDLNHSIDKMLLHKNYIFCFFYQKEGRGDPTLAVLDSNTGKTLLIISDVLDIQKQIIKPEALKTLFSYLKPQATTGE